MKKKAKRYDEGGGVREGRNSNIDDDTRARALRWVQQQQETESEVAKSAPKRSTAKASSEEPSYRRGASQLSDYRMRQARDAESGVSRGTAPRNLRDLESGTSRGRPAEEGASPKVNLRGTSYNPPKFDPESGERVDSSELGRNVSAAMNAMGPGRIATGLSLAARERMAEPALQRAYNARAAARRMEEGLNASEAEAVKQAIRERKTLNPLSWMAGPEGMANFKKGGLVKKTVKSAAPKASSASRRGDGIASKGKTKGRFV